MALDYNAFYFILCILQKTLEDWNLVATTEMIITDTAKNMMGIYNKEKVPDLPSHFRKGKCVCHILQLVIQVI